MVICDTGKSGLALLLVGSSTIPRWLGIGSGSGTVGATRTGLIHESLSERTDFTTRDISTVKEVGYVYDFPSTTMSGINFKEFALYSGSAITSGTPWILEGFDSITFDGSNELQVQITLQVF